MLQLVSSIFARRELRRLRRLAERVTALEPTIAALSDAALAAKTDEFRERLQKGETLDQLLVEAFACVREAAKRTVGERPFDVQVMGGIALHEGKIAEMKTGEGKTLTATMPVYLNALTGRGVHVVTVNDYLAKRDAQWYGPVYQFLGLTVGYIEHDHDAEERRAAYAADVTYVTNNELGFDYLRDNMAVLPEQLVQRELHYAIVDEVDSILIDEARTPLIISGMPEASTRLYQIVDRVVATLRPEVDFTVDEKAKTGMLTEDGVAKVERALNIDNLSDPRNLEIAHHVNASLKARYCYKRDVDYVVKDGEVIIVDEFTGRLQPGRRWSDGLHQAVEAKEGVKVEMERQTVATITYQNLFRLYEKLAGMTGTAKTEEPEFVKIYHMPVVVIPTNLPMIRKDYPDVVFKTEEAKFRDICAEILQCHSRGQPVLVGTRSIEVSERLSARLAPDKLQFQMLVRLLQARLRQDRNLPKDQREQFRWLLFKPIDELTRHEVRPVASALGVDMDILKDGNIRSLASLLDLDGYAVERLRQALESGIPHNVLNAKYHEQEAQIIAEAGRFGAVTIATNMAGRGVDIVLGGKPEDGRVNREEYEQVKALGGLHIIGSERHESRRIDNQLRGRSGRQGDPGSSRFFISLQDELMRLFGPERWGFFMNSWPEDEAAEFRIVTRAIENAQKKVEMRNFDIRKYTLKYDDVMNIQRTTIYNDRRKVLMGEDVSPAIQDMMRKTVDRIVRTYANPSLHPDDWDVRAVYEALNRIFPLEQYATYDEVYELRGPGMSEALARIARDAYEDRERQIGPELVRQIERSVLLRVIDMRWMQHLRDMDDLRDSVHLRAYGQIDPLIAYQKEAHQYFMDLLDAIAEDVTRLMFAAEVAPEVRQAVRETEEGQGALEPEERGVRKPVRVAQRVGRNDPCPCGSGKKYKKCCMK
jgi:preprotein translocase subunit SecA